MPDEKAKTVRQLQNALVQTLKNERVIRSRAVEFAFRHVPRHLFLPHTPLEQVYTDAVIPTKFDGAQAISSSSQPSMMAIMLEQAEFKAGQRALEIGAGTGYNAALIAHLIRRRSPLKKHPAQLTTLDFDADIVADARANLDRAGYGEVQTVQADGWQGYAQNSPYDRIMLTVRAADIAPAWVDQLAADGRLILPLDLWAGAQYSFTFQRARSAQFGDVLVSRAAYPCGFMPLRGDASHAAQVGGDMAAISTGDGLDIKHFMAQLSLDDYAHLLKDVRQDHRTGVSMSGHQFYSGGFWLWLASRNSATCFVSARGEWLAHVPPFTQSNESIHASAGIVSANGLALLGRDPARRSEVIVRQYGGDDQTVQALIGALQAWQAQGSPSGDQLQVMAYPAQREIKLQENAVIIRKPNFHYLLKWSGIST